MYWCVLIVFDMIVAVVKEFNKNYLRFFFQTLCLQYVNELTISGVKQQSKNMNGNNYYKKK